MSARAGAKRCERLRASGVMLAPSRAEAVRAAVAPASLAHTRVARVRAGTAPRALRLCRRYWHADTALLHRLAAEGCVVFSVSYRFAWQAPFPACLDDCDAALRFVGANAWRYGVRGGARPAARAGAAGADGDEDEPARAGALPAAATATAAAPTEHAPSDGDTSRLSPVLLMGASAGGHLISLLERRVAAAGARAEHARQPSPLSRPYPQLAGSVPFYPAVDVSDSLGLHLAVPTWLVPRAGLPRWLACGPLRAVRGGRSLLSTFFGACVLREHEAAAPAEGGSGAGRTRGAARGAPRGSSEGRQAVAGADAAERWREACPLLQLADACAERRGELPAHERGARGTDGAHRLGHYAPGSEDATRPLLRARGADAAGARSDSLPESDLAPPALAARDEPPARAAPSMPPPPPTLVVHGDLDSIVPIESSRHYVERIVELQRAASRAQAREAARGTAAAADGDVAAERLTGLLVVPGGRHSFSWLLSSTTLAVHDVVADRVHRMWATLPALDDDGRAGGE